MKFVCVVVALVALLVSYQPVAAEFYRYTDKHGNVLYTDDLSNIPADQREKAQKYEAAQSSAEETPPPEKKAAKTEPAAPQTDERKRLLQQEEVLNSEYQGLMKERDDLDEEKKSAVTPDQIKAYNLKVVDFNTRIKAYEEKRSAYSEKVDAYNDRLRTEENPKKK